MKKPEFDLFESRKIQIQKRRKKPARHYITIPKRIAEKFELPDETYEKKESEEDFLFFGVTSKINENTEKRFEYVVLFDKKNKKIMEEEE